jgi:two-component system, response regulator, stage 0 sporulation protein F
MNCYSILIVDDDANMVDLLADLFSSRGHSVKTASNGREALVILRRDPPPDMVISDIQMPVMNGFELFDVLDREFPLVKKVMITGCDIDEYLSLIRERNIGNILMKGGEFHIHEISRYIESLLTGDIFGLEKNFTSTITTRSIYSEQDAATVCEDILAEYRGDDRVLLEMAINELISNAVFHGVLELSHASRDTWNDRYVINDDKAVKVSWTLDDERIGVSVEDPAGRLKKSDVLRWLDHPVTDQAETEEHGRGLMLIRRLIDRFIINIKPGHRTECILIQYKNRSPERLRKPIIIHEL